MSLEKIDREEFLLIKYYKESASEVNGLQNIFTEESATGGSRDVIFEFVNQSAIYSVEIGVIVQFLRSISGTERTLRFVASNYVCEMLITMNIHKISNIVFYNSLDALQKLYPGVDFSEF